ncbi:hypothetical protein EVAR_91732_1 [Eumeta japonica]|uniref:Secreted protein n=1 Tax=Eumeta variegata TaxID=151549 RepID=A0A4C1T6N1_EUMVA|nr:hypothetical protein EVAR_91732_1 [Eumeta japonica]
MVRTSASFFIFSCLYVHQFFVPPTKFVPLSEYITLGVPLRAMNRRKASIMGLMTNSASSMCTARVVRHVNSARISFVSRPIVTLGRNNRPVHVKGVGDDVGVREAGHPPQTAFSADFC